MAAINPAIKVISSNLRALDIRHDLLAVADLIEICFASSMDADGELYLRQMRQAARDASFLHWATGMADRASMPLSGYVWEEKGQIIGNLSLIPLFRQGRRIYLIANVAVHPDYRQRGIARALTETAIDSIRQRQAAAVWLQVRHDNPPAIHLYQSLGFIERARRTTWQATPAEINKPGWAPDLPVVTSRRSTDWDQQWAWLSAIYPPEVTWNLPINPATFKPSLISDFLRFLNNSSIHHWAARQAGRLLGVLTWEASRAAADNLWMATTPADEDLALRVLLPNTLLSLDAYRPLALNYPAEHAVEALEASGFQAHHTLIWMEIRIKP